MNGNKMQTSLATFARRYMTRIAILLLLVPGLWTIAPLQAKAAPPFYLKNGDRVVFYGDSITAQRLYTRLVEAMVVSRYPNMRVEFYSAGVSGDTVRGGHDGNVQTRVERDVAPFRPTVLTVFLGMNDGHYTTTDTSVNLTAYTEGYKTLIDLLRKSAAPEARFTLISPSPYDEISRSAPVVGYSQVLSRYAAFVNELSEENHFAIADFNRALTRVLMLATNENSILAQELLPDHVHPSIWGHWVLASEMVKTWGFDPLVSSVVLNASQGTLTTAQKANVAGVTKTADGMKWSQTDTSLPLPLDLSDPVTQFLLKVSDLDKIDLQIVEVDGLDTGRYTLLIDDKAVGAFTREQMSVGINLAFYETPMLTQARSIDWDGAERRAKLSATRLSLSAQTPAIVGSQDAINVLDKLDAEMMRCEYEHAQPKRHQYELKMEKVVTAQ